MSIRSQGFSAGYYFLEAEKLPHEQAVPMANVLLSQSGIHLLLYVRQGDNGRQCGLMEEDAVSGSRPAISGQLAFQVH